MNILLLSEGDAESWDSWSGISKSIVDGLRGAGHRVVTGDVDLSGADRVLGAALTFAPDRHRWTTRYHLHGTSFRLRSRRAAKLVAAHREELDLILQVGATFHPPAVDSIPRFLCCDSNIRMAGHGAASGYGDAVALTRREQADVEERERRVYRQATGIFPLSERLRRSFIEDFELPPDRVHTIHAGPNFDITRIPRTRPRDDHHHAPTILFVGRQFHRKGGDLLVRAFGRIRTHLPEARLMIAGPASLDAVGPGITLLGNIDKNQPAGWAAFVAAYSAADVFCLPTRFEPYGVAFIEAMHFGLPCIGTEAWAVPEMIVDGETGYTVPVDDLDALTDRLMRLLSDRSLAAAMGRAGRERAVRQFTWDHVIERMMQIVRSERRVLERVG